MSRLDDLGELALNEAIRRLSEDKCEKCGRGAEAHRMAATALAKIVSDVERLMIAKAKAEEQVTETHDLNPLSLVATVKKLPLDHPKRGEMLELLDGHIIALQEARRSLSAEKESGHRQEEEEA